MADCSVLGIFKPRPAPAKRGNRGLGGHGCRHVNEEPEQHSHEYNGAPGIQSGGPAKARSDQRRDETGPRNPPTLPPVFRNPPAAPTHAPPRSLADAQYGPSVAAARPRVTNSSSTIATRAVTLTATTRSAAAAVRAKRGSPEGRSCARSASPSDRKSSLRLAS